MSLESSRNNLVRALCLCREQLAMLDATLADHPLDDPAALIDHLRDTTLDVRGRIEEALEKAEKIEPNSPPRQILQRWGLCLPEIHRSIHSATVGYLDRINSTERDFELRRLAHTRTPEWSAWSKTVRLAIASGARSIPPVSEAVCDCWGEFASRVCSPPAVQQTVTIYQTGKEVEPFKCQES